MKNYCVSKIGNIVVDSSEMDLFNEDTMIENAMSAGFKKTKIEIISEEEYKKRKALEPQPILEPSEIEILKEKIATQDMVIEELMFNIIPNITGGI